MRSLRLPRPFSFRPGQCARITTGAGLPGRLYSIVGRTDETEMEILYDVVPGGELTPRLAGLSVGDTVFVEGPAGSFADQGEEAVWIATGTGIAPFVSMAAALPEGGSGRTLLQGSRTPAGLFYRSLFEKILGERYLAFCTTEPGPGVRHGRLTAHLRDMPLPPEACYLLCGGPSMIVDVRELLIERGIPFARIVAEVYT